MRVPRKLKKKHKKIIKLLIEISIGAMNRANYFKMIANLKAGESNK
jgi:hypothetical protein